jgi:hypothetical protein
MARFLGPPTSTDVALPTFVDAIDQAWFIEPLNGPTEPRNFLDRFPEEVYNKSLDSHLVRFMYALLGPAGIGWLKKSLLEERLNIEDYGLELFDIESFYGDPFRFGRILSELYTEDPTGTLDRAAWDRIKARDEQYRSRATRYMQAARFGNAPRGMALAAESALGYPTDIVENYKYLFDIHSDQPMGLTYYGKTASTDEFITRPRPVVSRSEVQTITLNGNPTGGNFVLSFNGQSTTNYTYTPVTTSTAAVTLPSATISVPNTGGFPSAGTFDLNGQTVTYTGLTQTSFTGCTGGTGTQPAFSLIRALTSTTPAASAPFTYNNIPYNATPMQVEVALTSLPNIGRTGCAVRGGPIPNPYRVLFGGSLSNTDVATIVATSALTGGTNPTITVDVETGGRDASTEIVQIAPEGIHNLQTALDYLRPVPTIPSVYQSSGSQIRQASNSTSADSEYNEVVRFVTGLTSVAWPSDSLHWIEAGVERQAPRVKDDRQHHYVNFHNVSNVIAYTDDALSNIFYEYDIGSVAAYRSEHAGDWAPEIKTLIPFFRTQPTEIVYTADRIAADYPEPLVVTQQGSDSTGLINGIYPTDYTNLTGVAAIRYRDEQFWSSLERPSGAEVIEIDLGSVQAVNYLTFEALNKPYDIEIAYDVRDQGVRRHFVDVTPDPIGLWESSLFFDPLMQNPWHALEFHFTNALGEMIFTRYLRLTFTRRSSSNFLYDDLSQTQTPWSIEARNLRVGRNVVA